MAQQETTKALSAEVVAGGIEKFKQYKSVIQKTLPPDVNFERYWTMYLQMANTFVRDVKITDKKGVLVCMMNAAKLALIPDPVMGQIYFVPYAGKLTYQVGYKGMLELSRRSNKVSHVTVELVYNCDEFEFWSDENGQHYRHVKKMNVPMDQKKEVCAYSVFYYKNGKNSIHVMESQHIDEIKKMVLSRIKNSPWANPLFEPEMRKKTCLRRHWKLEPWSVEIASAIEHEESIERGEMPQYKNAEIDDILDGAIDTEFTELNPIDDLFGKQETVKQRQPGED